MPKKDPDAPSPYWVRLESSAQALKWDTTEQAIGKRLKVNQSTVNRWKKGTLPPIKRAVRVASDLGVCVEWLLTGRGPRSPVEGADPDLAQIVALWPFIDSQRRKELAGAAAYLRTISNPTDKAPAPAKV